MTEHQLADATGRTHFHSLRQGGLNWDSLPLRLFAKGNTKFWNPADIDFTQDAEDWKQLTEQEQRGVAMLEKPTEHLANFTVPVRPMLGCVAVAPGFGAAAPPAGDSGRFGGNMDFNEIVEGATVYLPIAQPGALLYIGDGHAVQGDGELNGNALETSMDVEFTVDVISSKPLNTPRVESPTHIMTVGLGGMLEDALRAATASLAQWLEQDYKLTPSEIAMVLGSSVEYSISEVADRNAGVVAKIKKDRLVFR